MKKKYSLFISFIFCLSMTMFAESGGPLHPLQGAYDVKYYHLDLAIDPVTKTIDGSLLSIMEVVTPIDTLLLDLDYRLTVDSVQIIDQSGGVTSLSFNHSASIGKVLTRLGRPGTP